MSTVLRLLVVTGVASLALLVVGLICALATGDWSILTIALTPFVLAVGLLLTALFFAAMDWVFDGYWRWPL